MQSQALLKVFATVFGAALGLTLGAGTADAQAARCKSGYVWRDARNGDGVCVTPRERDAPGGRMPTPATTASQAEVALGRIPAAWVMSGVKPSPMTWSA